jgi:hypothetical protein
LSVVGTKTEEIEEEDEEEDVFWSADETADEIEEDVFYSALGLAAEKKVSDARELL